MSGALSSRGTAPPLVRPRPRYWSPLHLVAAEFLTDDYAKRFFEPMIPAFNVLAKGRIHQGLVVAAVCAMDLLPEPSQDDIIDPNGDPSLTRRQTQHGTTDGSRKVVFPLHLLLSYRLRSAGVAARAEMILARCARQV